MHDTRVEIKVVCLFVPVCCVSELLQKLCVCLCLSAVYLNCYRCCVFVCACLLCIGTATEVVCLFVPVCCVSELLQKYSDLLSGI